MGSEESPRRVKRRECSRGERRIGGSFSGDGYGRLDPDSFRGLRRRGIEAHTRARIPPGRHSPRLQPGPRRAHMPVRGGRGVDPGRDRRSGCFPLRAYPEEVAGLLHRAAYATGSGGFGSGIPRQYFFDRVQKVVRSSVLAACAVLSKLGAKLREVDLKGVEESAALVGTITVGEALSYHWDWLEKRAGDYGADVRSRMEGNKGQTTVEYLRAQKRREYLSELFDGVLESVDVLAVPTLPVLPPLIEQKEIDWGRSREDSSGGSAQVYPPRQPDRIARHLPALRDLRGKPSGWNPAHRPPL